MANLAKKSPKFKECSYEMTKGPFQSGNCGNFGENGKFGKYGEELPNFGESSYNLIKGPLSELQF